MKKPNRPAVMVLGFAGLLLAATLHGAAQPEPQTDPKKVDVKKDFDPGKGPPMMVGGPFGQQRKLVKQFDKDGDGRLNNEERKAAREFIKKQGGPGGFGPGGGPKGVFGPGGFLTKPLLDALDTEKEGKLSKDQIAAAVEKFFAECDKDKQGTLSANAIAEGLNRLLPQRAGFFAAPPPGLPKEAPKAAAPKSGDAKAQPKADAKGPKAQPGFAVFGFGNVLATNIVKRAGPDKDGKI